MLSFHLCLLHNFSKQIISSWCCIFLYRSIFLFLLSLVFIIVLNYVIFNLTAYLISKSLNLRVKTEKFNFFSRSLNFYALILKKLLMTKNYVKTKGFFILTQKENYQNTLVYYRYSFFYILLIAQYCLMFLYLWFKTFIYTFD